MAIRFGPAGNSQIFYDHGYKSTVQAPKWLHGMGLNAFEYSFGRGVRLSDAIAGAIREQAEKYGVALSVHTPYYINLSAREDEKRLKNQAYFLQSARAAKALGATRMVFHPGSCSGMERIEAMERVHASVAEVMAALQAEGLSDIALCPETMGKINQYGSLEEILALCKAFDTLVPAIDFGHLHARTMGGIKTEQDYADILDAMERALGKDRARHMHVHFSRIEFSAGGERMHKTFADEGYGPDFAPLARQIVLRGMQPVIICESKNTMAEDAAAMKAMYQNACLDATRE